MGVWKLATKLQMATLRIAVLETMAERRKVTASIPGSPLLIQAWNETEEGSGLRKMFIGWAAEHLRTSPALRNEFAKSLPHEILSELVVVMSDSPAAVSPLLQPMKHGLYNDLADMETDHMQPPSKRGRKSELGNGTKPSPADVLFEVKPSIKKLARKSEPVRRPRRTSGPTNDVPVTPEQDLEDCRMLIGRMLTAPSYVRIPIPQ
jgi:hypothetical protein